MKYFFVLFFYGIFIQVVMCTEYSEYAAKEYSKKHSIDKAHITVKSEHMESYAPELNEVQYIVYGYGDLKSRNSKKQRITYICLINKDLKPCWSCIYKNK